MVFDGSADLQFVGTVTGLSLVHGVIYTVSVVARNSVGASETFTGMVFVPCEWDLTMERVLCVRSVCSSALKKLVSLVDLAESTSQMGFVHQTF